MDIQLLVFFVLLAALYIRHSRLQKKLNTLSAEVRALRASMAALQAAVGTAPSLAAQASKAHSAEVQESDTQAEAMPPQAAVASAPLQADASDSAQGDKGLSTHLFSIPDAPLGSNSPQPSPPPECTPAQAFAPSVADASQEAVAREAEAPPSPSTADPSQPPATPTFGPFHVIWEWLRANPLLYAGLIIFITGISFALTYLANNGFFDFSLEARLAGIALVGIGMLLTGYRLSRRAATYGAALMGGGAVILYLVLFAGAKWGLLSVMTALVVMLLLIVAVVCLALATNMEILAALAALGGFMAPVLLSTGGGNHIGLFTFYALLGAGNVALLRYKAWDIPVLITYGMVVGVAAFWARTSYVPSMYLEMQIFTIVFFVLFTIAGLLLSFHADRLSRTSQISRNVIHASLLFGVPLMLFGIQYLLVRNTPYALAFCSLCMAACYVGLAACVKRRKGAATALARDAYLINAVGFSILTVPLAVNAVWTTSVWAVQGLGMVWLGMRRDYCVPRVCGYLMQGLAALAFICMLPAPAALVQDYFSSNFMSFAQYAPWGQRCMSSVLLAASGLGLLILFARHQSLMGPRERKLFALWQLWPVLWYFVVCGDSLQHFWSATDIFRHILLISYSCSALLWFWLGQRYGYPLWAMPMALVLPLLVLIHIFVFKYIVFLVTNNISILLLLESLFYETQRYLFDSAWFLSWASTLSLWISAVAVVLSFRMQAADAKPPRTWQVGLFTVFVLCAIFLLPLYPLEYVAQAPLGRHLLFVLVLTMGALALGYLAHPHPTMPRLLQRLFWPNALRVNTVQTNTMRTVTQTGGGLCAVLASCIFIPLCWSQGQGPVPYIPLLSIVDMIQMLALGILCIVLCNVLHITSHTRRCCLQGVAVAIFVLLTLSLARAVSWYTPLLFDTLVLMRSPLFLMALSVLWGSLALLLIVLAARRFGSRSLWLVGAALLSLTVIKMLLFDMADRGAVTRVISFLFTGVLMLFLGYFCPLPPPAPSKKGEPPSPSTPTGSESMQAPPTSPAPPATASAQAESLEPQAER